MDQQLAKELISEIAKLRATIEKANTPKFAENDFDAADCFIWAPKEHHLQPVPSPNRIDISLIKGIDHVKSIFIENTVRFAKGLSANNTLLWGARGMGKSSLVKAVQNHIHKQLDIRIKLIEIHREDIGSLPTLLKILRDAPHRFILFCDDLSFDHDDTSYKSLKAALDGGIEGRPENVIFYATSNRRHLLPRDMMDNESSTAINPYEAIEEKVSLSDRFGLWLGFHKCAQDDYLDMIKGYRDHFNLEIHDDELKNQALEWATTRGNRSGRTAWQFIQDLAGQLGQKI